MKYCPHCGSEMVDDAKFCPNCGSKIDEPSHHDDYDYTTTNESSSRHYSMEEKPFKGKALGIVLPLFINIVGLILCLVLGDEECKKAAITTFVIVAILWVVFFTVLFVTCFVSTFTLLPLF